MISTDYLPAHFKFLSATMQSDMFKLFGAEFEGKGKLIAVAQVAITAKKACPHCVANRVQKRGKQSGLQLDKQAMLITDKNPSCRPFVKLKPGIKHKTVKSDELVNKEDKKVNLLKINTQHKQLQQFLDRFNGVSSKYRQNYLNRYAYGKNMKYFANHTRQWLYAILTTDVAYSTYRLMKENTVNVRTSL